MGPRLRRDGKGSPTQADRVFAVQKVQKRARYSSCSWTSGSEFADRKQEWNRQSRVDGTGQGLMQNGRRAGGAYQWAGTDGKMQRLQWAER